MNIKTIKGRTCILMPKRCQDHLKVICHGIPELKGLKLKWSAKNYHYFTKIIPDDILEKLKKEYKDLFEKPEVIKGYQGCPINLTGFKWKV